MRVWSPSYSLPSSMLFSGFFLYIWWCSHFETGKPRVSDKSKTSVLYIHGRQMLSTIFAWPLSLGRPSGPHYYLSIFLSRPNYIQFTRLFPVVPPHSQDRTSFFFLHVFVLLPSLPYLSSTSLAALMSIICFPHMLSSTYLPSNLIEYCGFLYQFRADKCDNCILGSLANRVTGPIAVQTRSLASSWISSPHGTSWLGSFLWMAQAAESSCLSISRCFQY